MALKDIDFKISYETPDNNLESEFYLPALTNSLRYDRGVGYFSAGWIRDNAKGLINFADNGGKARWITSPILDEGDWSALLDGADARNNPILFKALKDNITDLQTQLETETLSALAWMVADGILDFKLALVPPSGNFHAKYGIFTDEHGDRLSFTGSNNDSIQGTRNYEHLSVKCSWKLGQEEFVNDTASRFEKIWNNQSSRVEVFALPEAAKLDILKLRSPERPYKRPATIIPINVEVPKPHIPEVIQIRDYQDEAIQAWFNQNCHGLLEMATGTGKTITSIAASVRRYQQDNRLVLIITVPYQHLVDQWQSEVKQFGYQPILAYKSKNAWLNDLNHAILDFNNQHTDVVSVITTHTTFAKEDFQETIARINGPTMLIADEAHHLGAERARKAYPDHIPYRLALSATPDRWFDDEGTAALRTFFGETVFEFTLEQAIGVSLTPYYYYPHLVPLNEEEMIEYEALSVKIGQLFNQTSSDAEEILQRLLIKRSRLLNTAEAKIDVLSDLIDQENDIKNTLFYCAPGQIDDVVKLAGFEKTLVVRRFTAEEDNKERQQILSDFADGTLDALAAMKCLDEGVDVPSTQKAFFLASSSNPREFIQRRGRILRKFPGKESSVVHDLIAVPPSAWDISQCSASFKTERSIIKKELNRFTEFSRLALNKAEADEVLWDLKKRYGLLDS